MPRPCHATTMPFWKQLLKASAQRCMAWHVWISIGRPEAGCGRPASVRLLNIYGAPCKARNFNVVYIYGSIYVWQRWKPYLSICCTMFQHWINTESYPVSPIFLYMYYFPISVLCVIFVCKCVTFCCHRVSTQLWLNIYIISYITFVCKLFASYQGYPNYRWDLIRYTKG
jgi:hypothetical protein